MAYHKVLVVSDNETILNFFIELIDSQLQLRENRSFNFVCSPKNLQLAGKNIGDYAVSPFNIKERYQEAIDNYDLVISAHCKQLFPAALVKNCKCINIHPGLNPYNRGWFPQVFSILNGLPLGATIHEIDEEIDHGNIIAQQTVPIYGWDTSLTAYNRVQKAEEELLQNNITQILSGEYAYSTPEKEGNVNLKKDFDALREIALDEMLTFGQAIDRLRALTHPPYKNAHFTDPKTGDRIAVQITLEREKTADDEG